MSRYENVVQSNMMQYLMHLITIAKNVMFSQRCKYDVHDVYEIFVATNHVINGDDDINQLPIN